MVLTRSFVIFSKVFEAEPVKIQAALYCQGPCPPHSLPKQNEQILKNARIKPKDRFFMSDFHWSVGFPRPAVHLADLV